jgi:protein lin-54
MRRRSLFNEKAGASIKGVNKASDRHASSTTPKCKIDSSDNSMPLRTPPCALPGIGLHLNALAAIPKEKRAAQDTQLTISQCSNLPCHVGFSPPPYEQSIINDYCSQTTNIASAEDSSQGSPKKKRYYVLIMLGKQYFSLENL